MEKAAGQQVSVGESVELTAPVVHSGVPAPLASETTLEETKLIRRLQMMMNMVMQVIAQDASLTVEDASQMIADARTAALAMFPGKELAYDLIWRPRFQRLMRERFRLM
jgi:hypothetical protein